MNTTGALLLLADRSMRDGSALHPGLAAACYSLAAHQPWPAFTDQAQAMAVAAARNAEIAAARIGATLPAVVVADGRILVDGDDRTPEPSPGSKVWMSYGPSRRAAGVCVVCGLDVEPGTGASLRGLEPPSRRGPVAHDDCVPDMTIETR